VGFGRVETLSYLLKVGVTSCVTSTGVSGAVFLYEKHLSTEYSCKIFTYLNFKHVIIKMTRRIIAKLPTTLITINKFLSHSPVVDKRPVVEDFS